MATATRLLSYEEWLHRDSSVQAQPARCYKTRAVNIENRPLCAAGSLAWSLGELAMPSKRFIRTTKTVRDKLADDASINFPEVWIVNPNKRTVAIQILHDGVYRETLFNNDAVTPPIRFPSVTVDFSTIWQ